MTEFQTNAIPDAFFDIHSHGFVRVAAATPRVRNADPAYNGTALLEQAQLADADGADLVVFPELSMSGYANDDLHLQAALIRRTEIEVLAFAAATAGLSPLFLIGAVIERNGRLYNTAIAIHRGLILGVVPKIHLPNYREYYEKRWFASGAGMEGRSIRLGERTVPFGPDLLFQARDRPGFIVHIEICEDYWAPFPPSIDGALAGATILCNLSASNITVGKSRDRHLLSASQAMRCLAAYVYSAAGHGESTTDLAWDGQGAIHELGDLMAQSERFSHSGRLTICDVDTDRIRQERLRMPTFADAAARREHPETRFRRIDFVHEPSRVTDLRRPVRRFPFVPNAHDQLDQDCYEAFNIQVEGLITRYRATPGETMVIGISGGLDSTHALICAAKACDRMGVDRRKILGFTMPGFATGDDTRANAWALMQALGITGEEIDIRPAARQLLSDMGHPFAEGEPVYDVTFENVQAGLRTDYLFRLANQRGGFVVGTGDLSEMALGWCTYGVGDQMSHYAVNTGVPKTLIQYLIRWCIGTGQFDEETHRILAAILDTEISPELVPQDAAGGLQSTEQKIGPYELNDFFLFHILRYGQKPSKVAFLAFAAWRSKTVGDWPADFPSAKKNEYDIGTIARWLERFLFRFFQTSQFKRSAIPNGPKVSAGGNLSPRGDWRAPSDAGAALWIAELRSSLGQVVDRS